jgi:hypothetical protein
MMDTNAAWIARDANCTMVEDRKAVSWSSVKASLRDFDRTALLGLIQTSTR